MGLLLSSIVSSLTIWLRIEDGKERLGVGELQASSYTREKKNRSPVNGYMYIRSVPIAVDLLTCIPVNALVSSITICGL